MKSVFVGCEKRGESSIWRKMADVAHRTVTSQYLSILEDIWRYHNLVFHLSINSFQPAEMDIVLNCIVLRLKTSELADLFKSTGLA